jgi:UDP-N-acetylglucosamine diphosphorylase / glucose-1-phosphate thymidylyltransferase / UDP-N-acetylgalactosamine diphosphorylase / glucosamine-1-phosphate N-acetyltransferase / galactosamine-1-phosphate N-acetyltransferase
MNIILTMAGNYSRFKIFSNKVPKYLLPLGNQTIIGEVIDQIKCSCPTASIFLIANRHDQIFYPVIKSILHKKNISLDNLKFIDHSLSQLHTASHSFDFFSENHDDKPIVFTNIDTIMFNRGVYYDKLKKLSKDCGLIDLFFGNNPQFSYATINENLVSLIKDKAIISKWACSGLYGFGSLALLKKITNKILTINLSANFTCLYNYMLEENYNISYYLNNNKSDTIILGTPEEYTINIHKF